MKLLTRPEGQSMRATENASQELRSIQLDQAIRDKRKEIDDLEKIFIQTLSAQGNKNYEEERLWKEKISGLTNEVLELEGRRQRALVPLVEKEKLLQDRDSALLKREEITSIKESDLEYMRDFLENKLDAVSEREQNAVTYAETLNNREFNLQFQEHELKNRSDALTMILKESHEEIEKGKMELSQQKATLKGREVTILERERNVAMKEKSFANREKAILDKYATLQRAITETNLKHGLNIKL